MSRGSALLPLTFALACRAEPVLGADVDLSAAAMPSASVAPAAPSAVASAAQNGPELTRRVLPDFPVCPPPKPPSVKMKIRSGGDEIYGADQLRHSFDACLKRLLHEPAQVNVQIGITPAGRICGVELFTSVQLSAECVRCLARPMHSYRFFTAENTSDLVIPIRFEPTATASP